MKRLLTILIGLLLPFISTWADSYDASGETSQSGKHTIVLWTNQSHQGKIKVYYNNRYVGTITRRYSSAPQCGAPGCVTIEVTGKNNTFYGVAEDGTRWYSEKTTLRAGCTSIRLYCSSHRSGGHSGSSGGGSSSSSSSSGHTFGQTMGEAAGEVVSRSISEYGYLVGRAMYIDTDGVPYLGVDLGASVFYGEFARLILATGGMGGFYFYGGVGKDWIFNRRNSDKMTWHGGIGMRFSTDYDHFNTGLVIGENPLCYNQGLLIEFVWHHYFYDLPMIGFFVGAGLGLGNFKAKRPDLIWDVQVGLAIKILEW